MADVSANGHGCQQQMVETHRQSFEDYWMMGLRLNDGLLWPGPAAFGGQGYRPNTAGWICFFRRLAEQTSTICGPHVRADCVNTILVHLLSDEDNELKISPELIPSKKIKLILALVCHPAAIVAVETGKSLFTIKLARQL